MTTEIWIALIGIVGAIITAIITGVFSSRSYIKKQVTGAQTAAALRRKSNNRKASQTRLLLSCICRVLFWMAFAMRKAEIVSNGESANLDKAMKDVEAAEEALKATERDMNASVE